MRRKNPKRKTQYTKGKERLLEILGKKRLSPTKVQRRSARETMKKFLGYEPPRLSMAVGRKTADGKIKPGKASRYTVRGKQLIYEVEKERRPGERVARMTLAFPLVYM